MVRGRALLKHFYRYASASGTIAIGRKLLAKIKHANVITQLLENEIFKIPVVLNLFDFYRLKGT